jgi:hypothetical protein
MTVEHGCDVISVTRVLDADHVGGVADVDAWHDYFGRRRNFLLRPSSVSKRRCDG